MVLLSTWLGFEHISDEVMANSLPKWKDSKNMLFEWLSLINTCELAKGITPSFQMPDFDDHVEQIRLVCQSAPKIRALLGLVREAVRGDEKLCVWTLLPAEQLLLWDILRKLKIDARIYSSDLSAHERHSTIADFNHSDSVREAQILITSYSMSSYGLDLQYQCHKTVSFDIPLSRYVRLQSEYRFRRVGQTITVDAYNINITGTISDRQWLNTCNKGAPGLMAELNQYLFDISIEDGLTCEIDIGQWVSIGGRAVPRDSPLATEYAIEHGPLKLLTAAQLTSLILHRELGQETMLLYPNYGED